jgi:hypothetical protein
MIINTSGVKIDMTAIAEQFNLTTPVSLSLDSMTIPDNVVNSVLVTLAIIAGGVVIIVGARSFKKLRIR